MALGRTEQALLHGAAFVDSADIDTFAIASFLRQLVEVWELDTTTPLGNTLLPLLRSALLWKDGGSVVVANQDVDASQAVSNRGLEKVFGPDRFQTLRWWRNGLLRCRAVVRIEDLNGVGRGSGFLIKGSDLHPSLPSLVVITNCHIVPDAVTPEDAKVAFYGLDADHRDQTAFGIARLWWHSPPSPPGVDTAVLELTGMPAEVDPIPVADPLPVLDGTSRAYIIGHPRGYDQPQFSIHDALLLDYDDTRLHYRTPTEGGSSGSPVFDNQSRVIGLHRARSSTMTRLDGPGTYPASEALRIDAIRNLMAWTPPLARRPLMTAIFGAQSTMWGEKLTQATILMYPVN